MSDLAPAELAEELRLLARSLEGGRFKDAASQAAHMLHPAQPSPLSSSLLPCPFCATEATLRDYGGEWVVGCEYCRILFGAFNAADKAIGIWNTRLFPPSVRVPKVRTSHHRNKEEAARLQALVDEKYSSDGIAEGREAAPELSVASESQGQSRNLDRSDVNPQGGAVAPDTRQPAAGIEPCPSDVAMYDALRAVLHQNDKHGSSLPVPIVEMVRAALSSHVPSGQRRAPKVRTSHHRNKEEAARLQALVDERYAQSPGASAEPPTLESVADAIDEARYRHPDHPRQRPRPFNEADRSDREYAIRLARAALLASPGPNPEANAEIDRLRAQVAELERRLECR